MPPQPVPPEKVARRPARDRWCAPTCTHLAGFDPVAHDYEVRSSKNVFEGKIIKVRTDHVTMPGGNESQRDVVIHPGAVGVVAMDEQGRVMLIKQYRHPVEESLWELPAGLLDVEGELALTTAQRELG